MTGAMGLLELFRFCVVAQRVTAQPDSPKRRKSLVTFRILFGHIHQRAEIFELVVLQKDHVQIRKAA